MSKDNTPIPESVTEEINKLSETVRTMDMFSQSGLSEIHMIANLALKTLETPDGYRHLDNLAVALEAIRYKADDIKNCINCEAELVGSNYVDESRRRRAEAHLAHHKAAAVEVSHA